MLNSVKQVQRPVKPTKNKITYFRESLQYRVIKTLIKNSNKVVYIKEDKAKIVRVNLKN